MTFDQIAIIALLLCMFAAFALERVTVELVAISGLAIAFVLGLVPIANLFTGLSSPAVVTVVEILLVVSVLARTHGIERLADLIVSRAGGERAVLAIICAGGAFVSVFMNNIGALALLFPVALSVCARLNIPPGRMLMPLSFATLMGGTCSLTGTPANLVANNWLIRETGRGFDYFATGTVGLPLAIAGLAWLVLVSPRLFRHLRTAPAATDPGPAAFLVEARIPEGSALAGTALTVAEQRHELKIHDLLRADRHVFARRDDIRLAAGDMLLLEGRIDTLDRLHDQALLTPTATGDERLDVVVMPDSTILGSRIEALESFADHGVAVLGLASRRRRIEGRFGDLQIGLGDILVLTGQREALRELAADAGLLPLSARPAPRAQPDAYRSVGIFLVGIAATAFGLAPPEIAFGGVVLLMALTGSLQVKTALQDVNWTIVILLACMIPLGAAVHDSGAAQVIADRIATGLPSTDPLVVAAAMLVLAAMITPFVDNVSVAAVLSPIAAGIATRANVPIEPLLIAVAIGASLDFLTPFGHHNNTVIMGVGNYRFTDFPRLGLPLLLVCLATALLMLRLMWT